MTTHDSIEAKLHALGLSLPAPIQPPPGERLPFAFVRVHGDRAYISGHGPTNPDGTLAAPFGKVGAEVTAEQAYGLARTCGLNALAAVHALVGIDNVVRVVKVVGFVASAPGFGGQPGVVNGASELFGEIFGDAGAHARSAVGVSELPLNAPVEVEIVVEVV